VWESICKLSIMNLQASDAQVASVTLSPVRTRSQIS
jgi:hypothetical protein